MTRSKLIALLVALTLFSTATAWGEPLKLFVQEFKISGANLPDDTKTTLQSLFASRIEGDSIQVVDTAPLADVIAVGSYSTIGKVFSLDMQVKDRSGKSIARAFEQGESADDVIPAIGRLAGKVGKVVSKDLTGSASKAAVAEKILPVPVPVASAQLSKSDIIKPAVTTVTAPPQGDIIKPDPLTKASVSGMIGQRIDGVVIAIAPGKSLPGNEREIYVALERELRFYKQGKDLILLAATSDYRGNDKILTIDSADLDNDGVLELYVTLMSGEALASQVWSIENGKFSRIAGNLPYFFRSISAGKGKKSIIAQQMGFDADFQPDILEVTKKGTSFGVKPYRKLANPGSIYSTGWINAGDGKLYVVQFTESGYLVVRDEKNEELWRSTDRFGGSEHYFSREDQQNVRVTGERFRKVYLEQRIILSENGDLILPRNDGIWTSGVGRSFTKNSVFSFAWNGAVLDERWHTRESRNYLSDLFFDEERKELVLIEIIKKDGMLQKGASAFSIKKVE